jgi:hypothetical protein
MIEVPVFTHCPRCGDPLTNQFLEDKKGGNSIIKRCNKRTDHSFQCIINEGEEFLTSATVSISMTPLIRAAWNFKKETLQVAQGTIEDIMRNGDRTDSLPFFMPDFTDHKLLVRKLKLYITFS